MALKQFRAVLNPQKTPFPAERGILNFFAKDAFSLTGLLLAGALLQALLVVILPSRYALLPTLAALFWNLTTTAVQASSPSRNDFLSDVIPGRVSAQLPSSNGSFGSRPSEQPIVVLNIGVRFNHPLGLLAPGAKETGEYFLAMVEQLRERADEFGLLGHSNWRANERASQNTQLTVFYFRNLEGLHAFAHDALHRAAWNFYTDITKNKGYKHIGVFHEVFRTAPGSYETIYINMPPVLLGASEVKIRNEGSGEHEWIKPLVDADIPSLRSHTGRMGGTVDKGRYYEEDI